MVGVHAGRALAGVSIEAQQAATCSQLASRHVASEVIRSLGSGNLRRWRSLSSRVRPVKTVTYSIIIANAAGFYVVEVPLHKYRRIEQEMRLEREVRMTNQGLAYR